ncbi:MAG TPA: branched-chain amino acid ABC transporter substrate-binding protein [Solirubrobacteraceae bacterium]|nr:branched-chain amino acid ABC transporter substrate-binding protein [Solirubrobacteraceae bacterium]
MGSQLAIYSSLPLQGPSAGISQQIVNGEKLALAAAGGHAGPFKIGYVSLDDSSPTSGQWDPGVTATDAKLAADDTSTIAYLGEYDSGATAISLPLMNSAGILQVSPASPYVGLTSSLDAGQDEPNRFYLTGKRTFGRLQPGDTVQAAAQARLMRSLGVHSVYVLDDQDPFDVPLSEIVAGDAQQAGIAIAGHDSLSMPAGTVFAGEVEKIVESHAQAVFLAGAAGAGAAALWRALHSADPHLLLLGSSAMARESFTSQIGAAAGSTYLTTPVLAPALYPPAARRVLDDYHRQFGGEGGPYALYGYEAMSVVLAAIRSAGARGDDRQVVTERFFALGSRDSVIGRYSMQADGETTLSRYGVDRVSGGRPVFYRAIDVR